MYRVCRRFSRRGTYAERTRTCLFWAGRRQCRTPLFWGEGGGKRTWAYTVRAAHTGQPSASTQISYTSDQLIVPPLCFQSPSHLRLRCCSDRDLCFLGRDAFRLQASMAQPSFDEATWLAPFVGQLREVIEAVANAQRALLTDILPPGTNVLPLIQAAEGLVDGGWAAGVLADTMLEAREDLEGFKQAVERLIVNMSMPFLSGAGVSEVTDHFAAYAGSALGRALYEMSVSMQRRLRACVRRAAKLIRNRTSSGGGVAPQDHVDAAGAARPTAAGTLRALGMGAGGGPNPGRTRIRSADEMGHERDSQGTGERERRGPKQRRIRPPRSRRCAQGWRHSCRWLERCSGGWRGEGHRLGCGAHEDVRCQRDSRGRRFPLERSLHGNAQEASLTPAAALRPRKEPRRDAARQPPADEHDEHTNADSAAAELPVDREAGTPEDSAEAPSSSVEADNGRPLAGDNDGDASERERSASSSLSPSPPPSTHAASTLGRASRARAGEAERKTTTSGATLQGASARDDGGVQAEQPEAAGEEEVEEEDAVASLPDKGKGRAREAGASDPAGMRAAGSNPKGNIKLGLKGPSRWRRAQRRVLAGARRWKGRRRKAGSSHGQDGRVHRSLTGHDREEGASVA